MARDPKKNMFEEMREAMGEIPTEASPISREPPTIADYASEPPTSADNISEPQTGADDIEFVRISGRIAKRQRDELERIARRDGRLFSEVLREAIRDYLRGAR